MGVAGAGAIQGEWRLPGSKPAGHGAATVFARAGGDWIGHVVLDSAILAMPEIGIDVPLAEFYDGLVFGKPDDAKDDAPRTG